MWGKTKPGLTFIAKNCSLEAEGAQIDFLQRWAETALDFMRGASALTRQLGGSATLAFVSLSAFLFGYQLRAAGPLLAVSVAILYGFANKSSIKRCVQHQWPLYLLPLWALVSAFWSVTPGITVYYAVEFLLTVFIATLLGDAEDQDGVSVGAFVAFSAYTLASLVVGKHVAWGGGGGGTAFAGLAESKNYAGDTATLGVIAASSVLIRWLVARRLLLSLIAFGVVAIQIWVIRTSQSSGAILGLLAGLGAIMTICIFKISTVTVRFIALFSALSLLLVGLFMHDEVVRGFDWLLFNVFHKDSSLTGRVYLWYRARQLISERPFLGYGYYAFWQQGNLDAEGLWRYAGITSRANFNFHNTAFELLISMGLSGLAIFLGVFLFRFVKLLSLLACRPSALSLMWPAFFVYELQRMPIESVGLGGFSYATLVLYGAAAAMSAKLAPAATRRSLNNARGERAALSIRAARVNQGSS